jgi:hypothetical protein
VAPLAACSAALEAQLAIAAVVVELLGKPAHEREGLAVAGLAPCHHFAPLSHILPRLIVAINQPSLVSPR